MSTINDALMKIGFGKFQIMTFLITGYCFAWFANSLVMLSVLGPTLSCYWRTNKFELFILTGGVFIGLGIGGIGFGRFSDLYGRKPTLIVSTTGMMYFTLLSAAAPTIVWMILLQIIIGSFMGGLLSSVFVLMTEISPVKLRGTVLMMFQIYWAAGSLFTTTICYYIIPRYGWRILLAISAIPMLLAAILSVFVFESPRYLLLYKQKEDCLKVMNIMAKMNNSEVIMDVFLEPVCKSSFWDLFHPNYASTTILTCFLLTLGLANFYSIIFLTSILNEIPHKCLQNMSISNIIQINSIKILIDNSCCVNVTWEGYKNMFISATAPICCLPFIIVFINVIGRKKTLALFSVILVIGLFLLNLCMKLTEQSILLFILTSFASGHSIVITLYSTEVFPTSIRSAGSGFCQALSRVGTFLSPFIVNVVIVKYSFIGGTMILVSLNFVALIVSFLMPYETMGRKLYQSVEEEIEKENLFQTKKVTKYQTLNGK